MIGYHKLDVITITSYHKLGTITYHILSLVMISEDELGTKTVKIVTKF